MEPTDLPSLNHLRAMTSPPDAPAFHVGILIGPGFVPMDMVGVQTVFGMMPGAVIHLLWKTEELVEGLPSWWTKSTTTFADCPARLDVLAVPMLAPEIPNDPEVVAFVADKAGTSGFVIGICNGVLILGAAGVLRGRRVTASHNALPILDHLGVSQVVPAGNGVTIDGNLFTAGPGVGSFEASLLVVEAGFGRMAAELAEGIIEYDPHPPFGGGVPDNANPALVARFETIMEPLVVEYRKGSVERYDRLNA